MNEYAKISISKELHETLKKISDDTGLKMYHIENNAILEYITNRYPEYLNKK